MKIDSHHHFWKYSAAEYPWIDDSMQVLRADFTGEALKPAIQAAQVDAVVSVQAQQTMDETLWLLQQAQQYPFVAGVVGWVPLQSKQIDQHLEQMHRHDLLKGVRHVVQDEADDQFILGESFNHGVSRLSGYGLVYDILIFARHLPQTVRFVDRHPEQVFVLDHIAKPTIKRAEFDRSWAQGIQQLAQREHVACKFSGVVTEVRDDQWDIHTLRPYWDTAIEAFGSQRLMFGSDWPVCLLKTNYQQWFEVVSELASELSPAEQENFWANNAARIYSLRLS